MTKGTLAAQVRGELEALQQEHGVIKPEDVVAFARNSETALHSKFEWDDTKAAHEHRLAQARGLIRVFVTIIPHKDKTVTVTPAFVSLPSERGEGYRKTETVLAHTETREELLRYTIQRLISIKELALFPELSEVRAAIAHVAAKYLPAEELVDAKPRRQIESEQMASV